MLPLQKKINRLVIRVNSISKAVSLKVVKLQSLVFNVKFDNDRTGVSASLERIWGDLNACRLRLCVVGIFSNLSWR